MKFIEIDLDGHVARARLNEEAAPKTTSAIWEALPFEGRAVHAQVSGEMFRMLEATPVGDLPVENAAFFQYPGMLVYYPPIKEIAFCVGKALFAAPQGIFGLTPLAEIEGDVSAWGKVGDDLQYTGTKPIRFRKAADQTTPFRYPALSGRKIEVDFDGTVVTATLLEQANAAAAAAFARALPLQGRASNSTWAGGMTQLTADSLSGLDAAALGGGTTFHWPGYIYVDPRDRSLRLCYGDAQENVQGVPVPLVPVARMDGDISGFRQKAKSQLLEGAKPMTIRLASGKAQAPVAAASRANQ
ncbi:MAG TPA: DUF3830 family protein [Candidatus Limnocylindrales bacterium]|nr:DUF3830 family protein [Candidatus Limnocylindrales bacterium]